MSDAEPLLVSLHLPKTAGTSFADALEHRYGSALLKDYADMPMQAGRGRREARALLSVPARRRALREKGVRAVHGHFLPVAYRWAAAGRPARFITWLRDPLQRLVSHYHFWRRDYDGGDPRQPLRNRMLREDWSLERFCLGPEMRDLYRQYLWGFDPNRFAFIGVTERYAEDLARLLGEQVPSDAEMRLANPERGEAYRIPARLERSMREHHAADVALYRWVAEGRGGRFRWKR